MHWTMISRAADGEEVWLYSDDESMAHPATIGYDTFVSAYNQFNNAPAGAAGGLELPGLIELFLESGDLSHLLEWITPIAEKAAAYEAIRRAIRRIWPERSSTPELPGNDVFTGAVDAAREKANLLYPAAPVEIESYENNGDHIAMTGRVGQRRMTMETSITGNVQWLRLLPTLNDDQGPDQ